VKGGNVESALKQTLSYFQGQEAVETEIITLADKEFSGCKHCNWCIKNQSEGRFCVQEDDMKIIYPRVLEADGILLATPVHFGRLSGLMANMIDRFRAFLYGNVYKGRLRNKIGGALAVAYLRGGGVETALSSINSMFFIFQMIVATSRMYQAGAAFFSSTDGKGKVIKGIRHMALEDEFGAASGRLLAERMLELVRIVRAGQEALEQ
jgi:multimeric flavodoxin WrbA